MNRDAFLISDLKAANTALTALAAKWYDVRASHGGRDERRAVARSFADRTRGWNNTRWRSAALMAAMQGLSQLAHSVLGDAPERDTDPFFRRRIAREAEHNERRIELQTEEALGLIDELEGEGIETVLIKGLVDAHRLYPRPALRPMADTDIVVSAGDFERSLEVIADAGYVVFQRSALEASFCPRDNCSYPYPWSDHPENARSVDVHCGLRAYPLNIPAVFHKSYRDDCITHRIGGRPVRGLSLHDSIAVTALGVTNDIFVQHLRLVKLIDLALLLERSVVPGELLETMRRRGARVVRYVYPAFVLAERIFPASPAEPFVRLFSRYVTGTMREWMGAVDHYELTFASSLVRSPITLLRMRMAGDALDCLEILRRRLFPQREWKLGEESPGVRRHWRLHVGGLVKRVPAVLKRNPRRTAIRVPGFE